MRWTKYNGNIPEQHAAELHWRHSSDKSPLHMKQHVVLDKLIVEYEAGRYKYDLNNLEYLDESNSADDMPAAFQNEPVNFLLSNTLRHLTQDQQRQLCNALLERLPIPASIEDEAERLYPYTKEGTPYTREDHNSDADLQRSAHITAARQYMGEIDRLRAEYRVLVKLSEEIRGTNPIENLPALVGDQLAQKIYTLLKMIDSTLKQTHP